MRPTQRLSSALPLPLTSGSPWPPSRMQKPTVGALFAPSRRVEEGTGTNARLASPPACPPIPHPSSRRHGHSPPKHAPRRSRAKHRPWTTQVRPSLHARSHPRLLIWWPAPLILHSHARAWSHAIEGRAVAEGGACPACAPPSAGERHPPSRPRHAAPLHPLHGPPMHGVLKLLEVGTLARTWGVARTLGSQTRSRPRGRRCPWRRAGRRHPPARQEP